MNTFFKRLSIGVMMTGVSILALSLICYFVGLRINTTKSIPIGLYLTIQAPIQKGRYVLFCPPQRKIFDEAKKRGYITGGFCPGNYGYMMKRIVAMHHDVILVQTEGVRVNGKLLPLSTPFSQDNVGRHLPHYRSYPYTLQKSEVLLMSDVSQTSFDGRYFGPIHQSQIKDIIRPLIIF